MVLVIPTESNQGLDDKIAEHFGRCLTYTFLDKNGEIVKILDNNSQHMGGNDLPPEIMKKNNADILLCKGIGPRAISLCEELGIDVYVSQAETVKDIFKLWQDNKLTKAGLNDACDDHKKE